MRIMGMLLAAVALTAGAVLADTATTTTTTGPVTATTIPPPATTTTTTTTTTPVATTVSTTTTMACPTTMPIVPTPCAAKASIDLNGQPVVLVLGTEEEYALRNLGVHGVNWHDTSLDMVSFYYWKDPLLNSHPNAVITRHGNPFYPYYALNTSPSRIAGFQESYLGNPSGVNAQSQSVLTSVKTQFRNITPQQAMAAGYQPVGACIPNVGQVYVNQSLIDNRFDAMVPEAYSFDQKGRLVAVHYLLLSDQPFMAFGQQFQASPLVQGAQQLTYWIVPNSNGTFAMKSNNSYCP